jgi:hypothetical protein
MARKNDLRRLPFPRMAGFPRVDARHGKEADMDHADNQRLKAQALRRAHELRREALRRLVIPGLARAPSKRAGKPGWFAGPARNDI